MENEQLKFWEGDFGNNYIDRNNFVTAYIVDEKYQEEYGVSRTEINKSILEKLDKNMRILEVGSNVGGQLKVLREMGFTNLYGIEPNDSAYRICKCDSDFSILKANVFDIPFKDNYFDLVFTSGVLIHIAPEWISLALKEINRVSKRYFWIFEYGNDNTICSTMVKYRNNEGYLFKHNYFKLIETYTDFKETPCFNHYESVKDRSLFSVNALFSKRDKK